MCVTELAEVLEVDEQPANTTAIKASPTKAKNCLKYFVFNSFPPMCP